MLRDIDTNDVISCADQEGYEPIENELYLVSQADSLVFHNGINFDLRALKAVYSHFRKKKECILCDTLIMSRVLWPEMETVDEQKFSHID